MASFVLSEIPTDLQRHDILALLWKYTQDTLVLVDRDTPFAFRTLLHARDQFIQGTEEFAQAHIFAPVFLAFFSCLLKTARLCV